MSAGCSAAVASLNVWIKLATAQEDDFAFLPVELGECVGSVIERACTKYTHWRLNAGQVRLYPVTVCGSEPSEAEICAALAMQPLCESAAVASGAWLVAAPTVSAGGGSSRASAGTLNGATLGLLPAVRQQQAALRPPTLFIKLATAKEDSFAALEFEQSEMVIQVISRACSTLDWGGLAVNKVRLFLVAKAGQPMPLQPAIEAALKVLEPLAEEALLESAGVTSGAWLVAATQRMRASQAPQSAPDCLSFGGDSGNSVDEADNAGRTIFEEKARDVVSALFNELCPWAFKHSPVLSRILDRGGNQREADVMCYVEGDTLAPCAALAEGGACLIELPLPAQPALQPMPLPATRCFSPTDVTRTGPHKYFLAEVYSGHRMSSWAEKVVQLETLCARLMIRWQDQHAGVVGLPPVTDVTQVVGAAALIFSAGGGTRSEVLQLAQQMVTCSVEQCPSLARLAVAGRLLVIVLEKAQAPKTHFLRSMGAYFEWLQGIPDELEKLKGMHAEKLESLAAQLKVLTAALGARAPGGGAQAGNEPAGRPAAGGGGVEQQAVPVANARSRAVDRAKAALAQQAQQAQQSLRPGGAEGGGLPVGGAGLAWGGGQQAGAPLRAGQAGRQQGGQQRAAGRRPGAGQQGKAGRPSRQQRGGGKPNREVVGKANGK